MPRRRRQQPRSRPSQRGQVVRAPRCRGVERVGVGEVVRVVVVVVRREEMEEHREHHEDDGVPHHQVPHRVKHLDPRQVARVPGPVAVQRAQVDLLHAHRARVLLAHHGPPAHTKVVEAVLARQLHALLHPLWRLLPHVAEVLHLGAADAARVGGAHQPPPARPQHCRHAVRRHLGAVPPQYAEVHSVPHEGHGGVGRQHQTKERPQSQHLPQHHHIPNHTNGSADLVYAEEPGVDFSGGGVLDLLVQAHRHDEAGANRVDRPHHEEAPEVQLDAEDGRHEPQPHQRDQFIAAFMFLFPYEQCCLRSDHQEKYPIY
mmetsp:Transcript_31263/g.79731  ORF Transcript_31263/g.79731 Transcript_31263/m.79731 type:complete len:316 (-) Transcript_31263:228-1175(-)